MDMTMLYNDKELIHALGTAADENEIKVILDDRHIAVESDSCYTLLFETIQETKNRAQDELSVEELDMVTGGSVLATVCLIALGLQAIFYLGKYVGYTIGSV